LKPRFTHNFQSAGHPEYGNHTVRQKKLLTSTSPQVDWPSNQCQQDCWVWWTSGNPLGAQGGWWSCRRRQAIRLCRGLDRLGL